MKISRFSFLRVFSSDNFLIVCAAKTHKSTSPHNVIISWVVLLWIRHLSNTENTTTVPLSCILFRSNLWSLPETGEILYFTASIAVLYSPESHVQRHYRGHTDDIECLSIHPQLPLVASGQGAGINTTELDGSHVQVHLFRKQNIMMARKKFVTN